MLIHHFTPVKAYRRAYLGKFILVSIFLQGLQKYAGTPGLLYLCIKQKMMHYGTEQRNQRLQPYHFG